MLTIPKKAKHYNHNEILPSLEIVTFSESIILISLYRGRVLVEMPRRSAISLEQRKALRAYRRLHPTVSNTAIKRWFEDSFQQRIAHSSVSEILSEKYGYVDHTIHRQLDQKISP